MAEFFRQASDAAVPPAWAATFLCWLKQEVGLGRVLVAGLGLETVVKLNAPAQPGDELLLRCSHIDVKGGFWRLDVVPPAQERNYFRQPF